MTRQKPPILALGGELAARAAAADERLSAALRPAAEKGAIVLVGAEGRPLHGDAVATATALTVHVPGVAVLVVSDGVRDAPYNAARRFLSLDHLSGARAGVLFTAGDAEAEGTAERIDVIRALWNSWPVDTLIADRDRGVFATTEGIRRVAHEGARYRVAGPLNSPSSRQGEPVSLWRVSSAEELDRAGGLVDLVLIEDPELREAWQRIDASERPGLVAAVADDEATAVLLTVTTLAELDAAVAALAPRDDDPRTLRESLGLPERHYDLSAHDLAFGAA